MPRGALMPFRYSAVPRIRVHSNWRFGKKSKGKIRTSTSLCHDLSCMLSPVLSKEQEPSTITQSHSAHFNTAMFTSALPFRSHPTHELFANCSPPMLFTLNSLQKVNIKGGSSWENQRRCSFSSVAPDGFPRWPLAAQRRVLHASPAARESAPVALREALPPPECISYMYIYVYTCIHMRICNTSKFVNLNNVVMSSQCELFKCEWSQ